MSTLQIDNSVSVTLTDVKTFDFSSVFACPYETPCVHNMVLQDEKIGKREYEIQFRMTVK